jgi:epoxyqueuosine reductase
VISLSYNYYPQKKTIQKNNFILSKYAYGKDYHIVIKQKLKKFLFKLNQKIGNINARLFVDSVPVHERAWAKLSGIGWIGKNSLLLNKHLGSFFFLAEIISDLELNNDYPVTDHCSTCTACINACPTDAITEAQVIDANRCNHTLLLNLKKIFQKNINQK